MSTHVRSSIYSLSSPNCNQCALIGTGARIRSDMAQKAFIVRTPKDDILCDCFLDTSRESSADKRFTRIIKPKISVEDIQAKIVAPLIHCSAKSNRIFRHSQHPAHFLIHELY